MAFPLNRPNYLAELVAARHPIVFAGFPGSSPSVVVDNAGGIRQAFDHLRFHGHTRIAFIAGYEHQPGDSWLRFQAYLEALHDNGQAFDPASGRLWPERGQLRTARNAATLARGVPFTAVLAHNDSSCMGAMEALREAGLRIPEDVAVIGFDDVLEARALTPPLTTIHHPTFTLGGQAVRTMIGVYRGAKPRPARLSRSRPGLSFAVPAAAARRRYGDRRYQSAEAADKRGKS